MIISHKKVYHVLAVENGKSDNSSAAGSYQESRYHAIHHFDTHLNRVVHQHITCADYACLPESKLDYYAGSFVRNPYDRVYSGFRQLQTDLRDQSLPTYPFPEPWIRDLVMKQLVKNFSQLCQAQFEFDRWLDLVGDDQIYDAGRNTNFPLHPSHYWTHVGDQQKVDFIGRVESFEADFLKFLSVVHIDNVDTCNANVVDLEGGAANNPSGYRYVDRMDSRSIKKINRLFDSDFELFGYKRLIP